MSLPAGELRRRLSAQTWTAHNIGLGDGITTMPGRPDFLSTDLRLRAIERTVHRLMGDVAGRTVLDLGSLEGGFAVALAQRGAHVTAVEARSGNVDKIELLKEHLGLETLEVVHGNVNDVTPDRFGKVDVVLALGILYHLDEPVRWLRQLAELTGEVLVIDTHTAPPDDAAMARLRSDLRHLGQLEVLLDGGRAYDGRWFAEFPSTITDEAREANLWASWSNNRSFWLTEEALLRALLDAGFDLVYQQHDATALEYTRFEAEYPRAMYVATRSFR